MAGLEEEMLYRVKTTNPPEPTAGSPHAVIQYRQVSEAEPVGKRIRAKLAATGIDWMRVGPDGFWRPDVRAQFMTADSAVALMQYSGPVEQTERFKAAAESDQPTAWDEQYMRLSVTFDTGDARYNWLNKSLFVGVGRPLGTAGSNTPFTGLPNDDCQSTLQLPRV
jgi:hypothetical protein